MSTKPTIEIDGKVVEKFTLRQRVALLLIKFGADLLRQPMNTVRVGRTDKEVW